MNFDNTVLSNVAECSTRTAIEYVLHRRPLKTAGPLKAGSAVHSALEFYFGGKVRYGPDYADEENALKVFDDIYKRWSEQQPDLEERLQWGNVRRCLENYFFITRVKPISWVTEAVEQAFKIEVWPGHYFTGIIDIRGRDEASGLKIGVDHKTTGKLYGNWISKWRYSSQITGYLFAEQVLNNAYPFGFYVNAIDLKQVPGSQTKCKEHSVPYSQCGPEHLKHQVIGPIQKTPEQINAWWRTLPGLVGKLKALFETVRGPEDLMGLPMEGTFNGGCQYCAFWDYCHVYGRRPDMIENFTKVEEWNPLDGKTVVEGRVGG